MIARLRAASAEDRLLLIGLPLLVAALLIGWTVWVRGAALDDVEARLLTWPTVLRLTAEHLALAVAMRPDLGHYSRALRGVRARRGGESS